MQRCSRLQRFWLADEACVWGGETPRPRRGPAWSNDATNSVLGIGFLDVREEPAAKLEPLCLSGLSGVPLFLLPCLKKNTKPEWQGTSKWKSRHIYIYIFPPQIQSKPSSALRALSFQLFAKREGGQAVFNLHAQCASHP